jgi:glycine/D-amino acid oxidase-like deaminating enzyme
MKYLILGQGIAGSLMAWHLEKEGLDYAIIDNHHATSSTKVAAGLFNPFTGPRMVLAWKAKEIFKQLHECYAEIQKTIGGDWYRPLPLYRPFLSIQEQNDILTKAGEHPEFLQGAPDNTSDFVYDTFSGLTAKSSGYILTTQFLEYFRGFLLGNDKLHSLEIREDNVQNLAQDVLKIPFSENEIAVIDCRGYQSAISPLWSFLPWLPNKGEVIEIAWKGPQNFIANRKVYAVSTGQNTFKIGTTYNNNFTPETAYTTTETAKEELQSHFAAFAKHPFKVINQYAAVRPAIFGRRPVLGQHPEHKWLYILGGFGSKGISLAPYCASALCNLLMYKPYDSDLDINRFINK